MAKCAHCGKLIPEHEMTNRKNALDILGLEEASNSPIDNLFRSVAQVSQAWKCNRCGEWICNDCVCNKIIEQTTMNQKAGQIEHLGCGGMFKAPM